MAAKEARRCFSAPGKVFVLGEYAALLGLPSIVAAVGPRFRMDLAPEGQEGEPEALSPAGRLLEFARDASLPVPEAVAFSGGQLGLGSSSAQFALLYRALAEGAGWGLRWQDAWRLYRELSGRHALGRLRPSGADVVAQWEGGVVVCDPENGRCEDVAELFPWSRLFVLSAAGQPGRKVPTHRHLEEISRAGFPQPGLRERLGTQLERATDAVARGDAPALGRAMNDYAGVLADFRLESADARADREAFARLSGVVGAKGSGALQADAIVVLSDGSSGARDAILRVAAARRLEPVAAGWVAEKGIEAL